MYLQNIDIFYIFLYFLDIISNQIIFIPSASVFIICSTRIPERVQELMSNQLHHEEVNIRIDSTLRFKALWRFRWQIWPRLEDGANMHIKVRLD